VCAYLGVSELALMRLAWKRNFFSGMLQCRRASVLRACVRACNHACVLSCLHANVLACRSACELVCYH
jgi:hypothetical protein